MQDIITHHTFYVKDSIFCDKNICSSCSTNGAIKRAPQPYVQDGLFVWLDGEIFNAEDFNDATGRRANSGEAALLSLYLNNKDLSFLEKIDGIYSAVIYDPKKGMVYLITDRYGLRYLYYTVYENSLIWASEVKAILETPGYIPKIDPESVTDFFSNGYMLDNSTWFKDIELLPAGTVLSWDLKSGSHKKYTYWSLEKIETLDDIADDDEIAWKMGNLLVDAIKKRCKNGERIGIALSGGLDSRAITAAIATKTNFQATAFTYGKEGCSDVKIAKMVTGIKGMPHRIFAMDERNWLFSRIQGIWWTDGQFDMMHMHEVGFLKEIKELCDVNFDGYWGDAVFGGCYMNDPHFSEVYMLNNRSRRFIAMGIKLVNVYVEERLPFCDNKLVEYAFALPREKREHSHSYKRMLMKYFPDYYRKISWQETGCPISWPEILIKLSKYKNIIMNHYIVQILSRIGIHYDSPYYFTNYAKWIRQEPAKSFFTEVLKSDDAIYPQYLSKERVLYELEKHFKGSDFSANLCRYLTFEIWLQQVYNKKYRPPVGDIHTPATGGEPPTGNLSPPVPVIPPRTSARVEVT